MSKYTTEVRYICETLARQSTDLDPDVMAKMDWSKLTPFDYSRMAYKLIFDEYVLAQYAEIVKHQDILHRILYHYYTREIAYETYGLWKSKMNEFMFNHTQEYAMLYRTVDEMVGSNFQLYDDVSWTKTFSGTNSFENTGMGTSVSDSKGKQTGRFSDTPQGSLKGLENNEYMSSGSITDTTGNNSVTSHSSNRGDGNNQSTEKMKGKTNNKSYSALITEYRNAIMNVDMKIIYDVKDMFMNVW